MSFQNSLINHKILCYFPDLEKIIFQCPICSILIKFSNILYVKTLTVFAVKREELLQCKTSFFQQNILAHLISCVLEDLTKSLTNDIVQLRVGR